jgi:cytochrome P450
MTTAEQALDTTALFHPDTYVRGVPHELFAELRRSAGVVWVPEPPVDGWPPGSGYWAVLRHADAERVLRTPSEFSSSAGLTQIFDAPPPMLPALRKIMINMDPPEHSRLRGLLTKAFAPRAVARLEAGIAELARARVAAVRERGECDFARDIAADLPLLSLAEILGVPESDRWLMFDWSNRVIGILDAEYTASNVFQAESGSEMARRALRSRPAPDANGKMPDARLPGGMADLYAYARELAEFRRAHPGDDIMSLLLAQVDAEGGRVSNEEFEQLFWLFCIAGNETVRNALPGCLYGMLNFPDVHRELLADRSLLTTAVEDLLRWWSPVIQFRRTAVQDVILSGVRIRTGEKVVVYLASANRDETVFSDPDRIDIRRRPNPHVAFGHGPHFCVASQLARTQVRAMLDAVLDGLLELELAGPPDRLRSNFQNGIKHLPIRWRP